MGSSWSGSIALGFAIASIAIACSGEQRKYDQGTCRGAECTASAGGDQGGEAGESFGSAGSSSGGDGASSGAQGSEGGSGGSLSGVAGEGTGGESGGSTSGGSGGAGGSSALPRPDGVGCDTGVQCQSKVCQCRPLDPLCGPMDKVCIEATCQDGMTNGAESDTDCGGTCIGCAVDASCNSSADCAEGACEDEECQPPSCTDELKNGSETDRDCGGSCGATCGLTKGCFTDGDCTSGLCRKHQCVDPGCTSGSQSGSETGVDCGGPACACCASLELEYTTGNASAMFGSELGPTSVPRAVGQGMAFKLPSALWAKNFGLNFESVFHTGDYQPKAVTLVLQVRDAGGKILNVYEKSLDATFAGGWVMWDITLVMKADETYSFTAYVKDGFSNFVENAVRADPLGGYAFASRHTAVLNDQANDDLFEPFLSWTPDDQWDLHFRLNGCPL